MVKKIYVIKNGEQPGICLDWLTFFERVDGRFEIKYKIFIYKTEVQDEDENVPFSMKWAMKCAREYLDEPEQDTSDIIEEAAEAEETEEVELVVLNREEVKKKRREAMERHAADQDAEQLDAELRKKLCIREDLHMGSVWLDFVLDLVGGENPAVSGGSYTGRYWVTSLYTALLYLVLEPGLLLKEVYNKYELLNNTPGNFMSKQQWYETIEFEMNRSEEFKQLKDRFAANGLKKLDLSDVRHRNAASLKSDSVLRANPSYFNMLRFLEKGNHTIVDLYDELINTNMYKDELLRISGAVINPDLARGKRRDDSEKYNSLEQLVEKTRSLRSALKEVIVGQDAAIDKLERAFFHNEKSGAIKQKAGPRCAFLFAGPPGVGKTYMAETFAKELGISYHRFDMASYGSNNAMEEIVGISSFYVNSKPGVLTSFVEENPKCVLLFDEIEKASIEIIRLFLQILDEGKCFDRYYDANVSFQDCIIIMTTNAGKQLYENAGNKNLTEIPDRVIIEGFKKDVNPHTKVPYFPPEIVSRMAANTIIMFNHLKAPAIRQVIKKDVEKNLSQNKENYGFDISKGSDIVAATVQYAIGGGGDARNASKLAGKLIDQELYELFSLVEEKSKSGEKAIIKQVSWECDFDECSEEVRQFYLGEKNCVVPILKEVDRECTIAISKMLKVVILNDSGRFLDLTRQDNTLFAVIDYAYGLRGNEASMSISDIKTIGSVTFETLRKENPELPVYLLQSDENYRYSESEKDILLRKGVEGFIRDEHMTEQLSKAYTDICCINAMETLTVRHQVLTYSTRKEIMADKTAAKIIFYNLKLEMAIDAEDKDNLISDELRPNKHWDDVYVSADVRKELEFFIKYLKNPKEYMKTGVRVPRGALMFGPPGTGKTSLAKVVATESQVNFLTVSADELLNEGAQKVHQIFQVARKYAPAVLFIDEIDAIGMSRKSTGSNFVLNALLTEMDGFKRMDTKPVFVMAATNLKGIDAALARRFDRTFVVGLPDEKGRRWLLKRMLSAHADMFHISKKELDSIVARSSGLSPADIENMIETALREGVRNGKRVTDALLDEIFEQCSYGDKTEVSSEKEVEQTAYHEAGHAIIELFYGRTPEYMSVVARANFNGYVLQEKMNEHPTKERLLQRICVSMGGRAAEIEFGYGLTPGASGDLASATKLAIRMVCEFGMYEEEMGLRVLSEEEFRMDEKAKALVNKILQEQLAQARTIIRESKDAVVRLVKAVLQNEQKYLTKKDIMDVYHAGKNS